MAISVQKATIAGNVGRIEPMKQTANDKAQLRFSVGCNKIDRRNDTKKTTWYSILVFGKQAENAQKFLSTGMHVVVMGDLSLEAVQKMIDGKPQVFLNATIIADEIIAGGGKGQREDVEVGSSLADPSTTVDASDLADEPPF